MKSTGLQITLKAITLALLFMVIIFLDYAGLLSGINNYFYDTYFRIRGPGKPSGNILIIATDEKSLEKLGRWPIRRAYYAPLLDRLKEADVVAFDIIMAEPTEDDGLLSKAMHEHGRVILPIYLDDGMHLHYPVPSLSPYGVGHVHLEQHIDGMVREIYHTIRYNETILKSFPAVIYESFTGRRTDITLKRSVDAVKNRITQMNKMHINYCGGPGTFTRVSLIDVLENVYPSSFYKHKICLVGNTAKGLGDRILTPFSKDRKGMPGVEVYANIVNSLLYQNAIKPSPQWALWASALLLGILALFWSMRITEQGITFFGLITLAWITTVDYLLFAHFNIWVAPGIYYVTTVVVLATAYVLRLNNALSDLNKAYKALIPHMRWQRLIDGTQYRFKGIKGFLTSRGINTKIKVLGNITDQLVFEKELIEKVLLTDVHGVILFGPDKGKLLANSLADSVSRQNSLATSNIESLMQGLSPFVIDKIDLEKTLEMLYTGQGSPSFTVSFPVPQKAFYKVAPSPLRIGDEIYVLLLFSDITKVKELEILKGEIVSLISHEIKTPLTSIQGFSEILASRLEGSERDFAKIIHGESERLVRFLNTFLDISRIEEGRKPINIDIADPFDVIHEAVLAVSPIADEAKIKIHTEMDEKIAPVMIDGDLTKQCIMNLVENAIKYSPQGSDVIIRLTEPADCVTIDVVDHGIGIQKEDLARVFDKFYRSPSADAKGIKGSGLGLAFVKEAMEAQGDAVSVESSPGQGSVFSIYIKRNR